MRNDLSELLGFRLVLTVQFRLRQCFEGQNFRYVIEVCATCVLFARVYKYQSVVLCQKSIFCPVLKFLFCASGKFSSGDPTLRLS